MKSYHLSKEQVFEIAMQISTNLVIRNDQEDLQEFANAVLDQVLGEPVAEVVNLNDQPIGAPFFDDGKWSLKVGQKLYAPKEQS